MWWGSVSDSGLSCHGYSETPAPYDNPSSNRSPTRYLAELRRSRIPVSEPHGPSPADRTSRELMTRSPQGSGTVPRERWAPTDERGGHRMIGLGRVSAQLGICGTSSGKPSRVRQRIADSELRTLSPETAPSWRDVGDRTIDAKLERWSLSCGLTWRGLGRRRLNWPGTPFKLAVHLSVQSSRMGMVKSSREAGVVEVKTRLRPTNWLEVDLRTLRSTHSLSCQSTSTAD